MTTKQVEFTEQELLASHDYAEPLVAGGVRCHGGFDDDGTYVSPRTKNRWPAIEAWDEQRLEQFGTAKLDIGLETWPENFPNVAQTGFLIRNGVREPTISELTRIGTVEGFGSMLRYSPMPDLQACFDEEIRGTGIDHLARGLYEAHARDEAGFEDEAGHNLMWFAARDLAFEHPVTEDQTDLMLQRMGIPIGDPKQMAKLREAAMANRRLPSDISFELEALVGRMVRLLFIEISAFHAFAWAETFLSDPDLVAGDGEAARLIEYIRADESPHVAYLGIVLSEMRDRTWVGETGTTHDGDEMISAIWDAALRDSVGVGRQQMLTMVMSEIDHAVDDRPDRDDLLDEFFALGNVQRLDDGTWIDHTDQRDARGDGAGMRFGIFYEHQLPRPWEADSERQLMQDALDQCEFADKLGFDYVWEVEHHFLEEYSHSSAPEVFLAAVSQRTKDIRLGHGIVQTAPGYNHPARTAERIATLDLVSNGRVEFGSGESSSEAELGGFGIDYMEKRDQWKEGLEVAIRCMTEEPFGGHDGKYVSIPPRNVVPKPVQKPHPPLWLACSRRETILLAAEYGMGALTFAFIDPEEAVHWVADYRSTFAEKGVPIGKAVNNDIACVSPMMCARDENEAIARGLEGGNFFGYSLAHFYVFGDHVPGKTDVWQEFQKRRGTMGYSPEAAIAAQQETLGAKAAAGDESGLRGCVGTPEQIREFLRRFENSGIDQLIFVLQSGKNRHEHIMESLELFGTEVMPEFKERDEKLRAAKAKDFEPLVEAAMARKVDDAPRMPDDYVMRAIPKQMVEMAENDAGRQWMEDLADKQATGDRDDTFERGLLG